MPIYKEQDGTLEQIKPLVIDAEKKLQRLVESNLEPLLDMHFLATEYPTTHGGRIDTLAVERTGAPVIIEYKRHRSSSVINQALSYVKWLQVQKAEFLEMLMVKQLGQKLADQIKLDFNNPRIICIAESFNKFDIDTAEVIPMRIDLMTYRYYESGLFSLEPVHTTDVKAFSKTFKSSGHGKPTIEYSVETHLEKSSENVKQIFSELRERIFAIDQNIQEKATSVYIAYRITKIFVELYPGKDQIKIYLRPIDYNDPGNRVDQIPDSYNYVLNRRLYISKAEDIDEVMEIIEQSYHDVL